MEITLRLKPNLFKVETKVDFLKYCFERNNLNWKIAKFNECQIRLNFPFWSPTALHSTEKCDLMFKSVNKDHWIADRNVQFIWQLWSKIWIVVTKEKVSDYNVFEERKKFDKLMYKLLNQYEFAFNILCLSRNRIISVWIIILIAKISLFRRLWKAYYINFI